MTGNDILGKVTPSSNSGLALVTDDGHGPLGVLLCVNVKLDVEDDDGSEVAHALLGNTEQPSAVGAELDPLDGGGELPGVEAAARLDLPQLDGVVGGTSSDDGAGRVAVDGPDGTLVAVVGTQALAIVCEPDADVLILGYREDEVAVGVESTDDAHEKVSMMLGWRNRDQGTGRGHNGTRRRGAQPKKNIYEVI